MTTISWVAVLREWFGAERYARDYEYLDANYRKQAEAVARLSSPDAAGSGGEARDAVDARAEGRKILEAVANGPRAHEYERAAFRLIRQMDGTWYDPKEYGDDWLKVLVALTPDPLADAGKPIDATQTREAELVAALEPFAFKGATIPRGLDRDLYFFTDSLTGRSITLGHVLDARAALNGRAGA